MSRVEIKDGQISKVILEIKLSQNVPSFKNRKRSIKDRTTGKMRPLTEPKIKARMEEMENGIVFALYSAARTIGLGTDSECLKQFRTWLCGLSDDSLKIIPECSWGVEYVPEGQQGFTIEIEKLL